MDADDKVVQIELHSLTLGKLADVKIPRYDPAPHVLVWKKRYFIAADEHRYVEAFVLWLPDATGEGREQHPEA